MNPRRNYLLDRLVKQRPDSKSIGTKDQGTLTFRWKQAEPPQGPSRLPALRLPPAREQAEEGASFLTSLSGLQPRSTRTRVLSLRGVSKTADQSQVLSFISEIEKREWLSEQFCYMNRGTHFYDWRLVSFQEARPSDYMVVCKRGLTYHGEDGPQFISKADYQRESALFNRLRSIPFFAKFHSTKCFSFWKYHSARKNYLLRRKNLASRCFLLQPFLRPAVEKSHALLNQVESLAAMTRDAGAISLQRLEECLEEGRRKVLQAFTEQQGQIKHSLQGYVQFELEKFKAQSGTGEGEGLPVMEYTRAATLRDEKETLLRLVKLVDYMVGTARQDYVRNSLLNLFGQLRHFRQNITMSPMLALAVDRDFEFRPTKDEISSVFLSYPLRLHELFEQSQTHLLFAHAFEQLRGEPLTRKFKERHSLSWEFDPGQLQGEKELRGLLDYCWQQLQDETAQLLCIFREWQEVMGVSFDSKLDFQVIKKYLVDHQHVAERIRFIPETFAVSLFKLNLEDVRCHIISSLEVHHSYLTKLLPEKLEAELSEVYQVCNQVNLRLSSDFSTLDEYVEFLQVRAAEEERFSILKDKIFELGEVLQTLEKGKVRVSVAVSYMREVLDKRFSVEKRIGDLRKEEGQRRKHYQRLIQQLAKGYQQALQRLQLTLDQTPTSALSDSPLDSLEAMGQQIRELSSSVQHLHRIQRKLQLDLSEVEMNSIRQQHAHYHALWSKRKFWTDRRAQLRGMRLGELTREEAAQLVGEEAKDKAAGEEGWSLLKTLLILKSIEVDNLQECEDILGVKKIQTIEIVELQRIQAWKQNDRLTFLVEKSRQQERLYRQLNLVDEFWKTRQFAVRKEEDPVRDYFLVQSNQALAEGLEEVRCVLRDISRNRYSGKFAKRLERSESMLEYGSQLLQYLLQHQGRWSSLARVFGSSSAQMSMSKEYKQFQGVDYIWRKTTKALYDSPLLKKWVDEYQSKTTLLSVHAGLEALEAVLSACRAFFQTKRVQYNRFYLLNDDQLLQLIAQCSTPGDMWPFLALIHPTLCAIKAVDNFFQEVVSSTGESLRLRPFLPRGEVEEWFAALDEAITSSSRNLVKTSLQRYRDQVVERSSFIGTLPCCLQLVIDNIIWSELRGEIEISLLYSFTHQYSKQLIGTLYKHSDPVLRLTLESLVLNALHNLEQVSSAMPLLYRAGQDVAIHFAYARFSYCFEFVAMSEPLAITPAVERVWVYQALSAPDCQPSLVVGEHPGQGQVLREWDRRLGRHSLTLNFPQLSGKAVAGLMMTGRRVIFVDCQTYSFQALSELASLLGAVSRVLRTRQVQSLNQVQLGPALVLPAMLLKGSSIGAVSLKLREETRALFFLQNSLLFVLRVHLQALGLQDSSQEGLRLHCFLTYLNEMGNEVRLGPNVVRLLMKELRKSVNPSRRELLLSLHSAVLPQLESSNAALFYSLLQVIYQVDSTEEPLYQKPNIASSIFKLKLSQLKQQLAHRSLAIVVGAARSGKSTLLSQLGLPLVHTFPGCFSLQQFLRGEGQQQSILAGLVQAGAQALWVDCQCDDMLLLGLLPIAENKVLYFGEAQSLPFDGNILVECCSVARVQPSLLQRCAVTFVESSFAPKDVLEQGLAGLGVAADARNQAVRFCQMQSLNTAQVETFLSLFKFLSHPEKSQSHRAVVVWLGAVLFGLKDQWPKVSSLRLQDTFFKDGEPTSVPNETMIMGPQMLFDQIYVPLRQRRPQVVLLQALLEHQRWVIAPLHPQLRYKLGLARVTATGRLIAKCSETTKRPKSIEHRLTRPCYIDDVAMAESLRAFGQGYSLKSCAVSLRGALVVSTGYAGMRAASEFVQVAVLEDRVEQLAKSHAQVLHLFFKAHNFKKEVADLAEQTALFLQLSIRDLRENLPLKPSRPFTFGKLDFDKVMRAVFSLRTMHLTLERQHFTESLYDLLLSCCRHKVLTKDDERAFEQVVGNSFRAVFRALASTRKDLCLELRAEQGKTLRFESEDELVEYLDAKLSKMKHKYYIGRQEVRAIAQAINFLSHERGHLLAIGQAGVGKKAFLRIFAHLLDYQFVQPFKDQDQLTSALLSALRSSILQQKRVMVYAQLQRLAQDQLDRVAELISEADSSHLQMAEGLDLLKEQLRTQLQAQNQDSSEVESHWRRRLWNYLRVTASAGTLAPSRFADSMNVLLVSPWSHQSLVDVARATLSGREKWQEVLAQSFLRLQEGRAATVRLLFTNRDYLKMVGEFQSAARRAEERWGQRRSSLVRGVDTIKRCEEDIVRLKSELAQFQSSYPQTVEMHSLEQLALERQYSRLKTTKEQIQASKDTLGEEQNQLTAEKDSSHKVFLESKRTFEHSKEAILAITRNELSEVKALYGSHALVGTLLEALMVLLGEEPREDNIRRALTDPNFLLRLKSVEPSAVDNKTYLQLKAVKLKVEPFRTLNLTAATICQWIIDVIQVIGLSLASQANKDALQKQVEALRSKRALYEAKCQQHEQIVEAISKSKERIKNIVSKLAHLQSEISKVKGRLENAASLTTAFKIQKARWLEELASSDSPDLADAVAAAVLPALCCFELRVRLQVKQKVDWILQRMQLKERLRVGPHSVRELAAKGVVVEEMSLYNAVAIGLRRFSLICDPEALASEWLSRAFPHQQIEENQFVPKSAAQNCLLLRDPSQPILRILKEGKAQVEGQAKSIHPSLRVLLYCRKQVRQVTALQFQTCAVVNFQPTVELILRRTVETMLQREQPESLATMQQISRKTALSELAVGEVEEVVLEQLKQCTFLLDNTALVQSLTKLTDRSTELAQAHNNETAVRAKLGKLGQRFLALGQQACQLHETFLQFRAACGYNHSFTRLNGAVLGRLVSADDYLYQFYSYYCEQIKEEHRTLLAFLLALNKDLKSGKVSQEKLAFFLRGELPLQASRAPAPKKSVLLVSVSETTYRAACGLSMVDQSLAGLAESLNRQPKQWQKWIAVGTLAKLPDQLNKLQPFSKLLVAKLLRPQLLLDAIQLFIVKRIGSRYVDQRSSSYLQAALKKSQSSEPWLAVDRRGDLAEELSLLLTQHGKPTRVVNLAHQQLPVAGDQTLLLKNWHMQQKSREHVAKLLQPRLKPKAQNRGRTIVVCGEEQSALCWSAQSVMGGLYSSLGQTVPQYLNHLRGRQIDTEERSYFKKLLYIMVVLFAVIRNRGKFGSIGWKGEVDVGVGQLQMAVTVLLNSLDPLNLESIAQVVKEHICLPKLGAESDFETMGRLVDSFICQEVLQSFNIANILLPESGSVQQLVDFAREMPKNQVLAVYGLNRYAKTSIDCHQARKIVEMLTSCKLQRQRTFDQDTLLVQVQSIKRKLPREIRLSGAANSFIQTAVRSEAIELQASLQRMQEHLGRIQAMLIGVGEKQPDLAQALKELAGGKVPPGWQEEVGIECQHFDLWVETLSKRANYLRELLEGTAVKEYIIGMFGRPKRFIRSMLLQQSQAQMKPPPQAIVWVPDKGTGGGVRGRGLKFISGKGHFEEDEDRLENECPSLKLAWERSGGESVLVPVCGGNGEELGQAEVRLERGREPVLRGLQLVLGRR